jgi:hypothetical protein
MILRGPTGALCGYVGVPPGHPWHGRDYDEVPARAHGGLTYAAACQEDGHICHVPLPGESPDVWWLGFDCAHAGDNTPSTSERLRQYGEYRTIEYVRREVEELAQQAREACK